ncbi:hypothetical protein IG631_18535 [Alternaria alternata]|nr:hypothetical protein IG631_18535 [Alternaria alternata]
MGQSLARLLQGGKDQTTYETEIVCLPCCCGHLFSASAKYLCVPTASAQKASVDPCRPDPQHHIQAASTVD